MLRVSYLYTGTVVFKPSHELLMADENNLGDISPFKNKIEKIKISEYILLEKLVKFRKNEKYLGTMLFNII